MQAVTHKETSAAARKNWQTAKDFMMLMKPSLSIMVAFSSVMSFLLTKGSADFVNTGKVILLLFTGGLLLSGGANAANQVLERDTDSLMKRTAGRPVASGRLKETEGWIFAYITGIAGVLILGLSFNWLAGGLAALSFFLYAFIYTPLKKVSSIAVLAGAVPGALPCLIGWAAGDNQVSLGGWIVFAFQFFWQFPHFWAIAWVAHKDYTAAGFKLLPSAEGPSRFTALQTVLYSLLLVPVTLAPFFTGICSTAGVAGMMSVALVVIANCLMIVRSAALYRTMNTGAARKVMFGSYIYLPVVMLAWLLAKI